MSSALMKLWESMALVIMGGVFLIYIAYGTITHQYTLQASVVAGLLATIAVWTGLWTVDRRQ